LKVAIVQMDVAVGDPLSNARLAVERLEEAAERGAGVVVLPELWSTGYTWLDPDLAGPSIHHWAGHQSHDEAVRRLRSAAQDREVWVVAGTVPEERNGRLYNTSLVFSPSGEVAHRYSKAHLIGLLGEPDHFSAGAEAGVFALDNWTAGVLVCYDLRFPELARTLVLDGAEVLFIVAQWPIERKDHWRLLVQARAVENQCFVVAANRTGRTGSYLFAGSSMIVDPQGRVLAEGDDEPCVLEATLDRETLRRAREFLPCLEDRVPFLYRIT